MVLFKNVLIIFKKIYSKINFIEKNINKPITKTAFINKRNDISPDNFLNINNTFIDYIFKNDKKSRIYGVD